MSTSLLYHTCGIRGYEYRSTEFVCGTTFVHIGQAREKLRCPQCGREEVSARGSNQRVFRSVPIGSKPVSIVLDVARVYCPKCDATRQVQVGFADEYRRHTRAFARYAVELTGMATIQDVANHLCVGWDLIKELKKSDLARRYRKPKLRRLKHLAVDEICIGRGRALPNAGARSRHGRDRVCRAGKGGRCPETLLETAPGVAGEDPGRGGRLVSGIHQGGPGEPASGGAGLRPVSCREAVQ